MINTTEALEAFKKFIEAFLKSGGTLEGFLKKYGFDYEPKPKSESNPKEPPP